MMKKKKLWKLALVMAAVLVMTACGSTGGSTDVADNGSDANEANTEENSFTIGFANTSQDTPFFAMMTPIIEEYGKGKGIEVISVNADNDVVKQNQDIQDLVIRGVDLLIVNPVNEDGISAGIQACTDAGIPVVTIDKSVRDGNTVWVGRDNQTMGRLVGERLIELLGGEDATGVVLEIQGSAGSTTMMARRDGFHEALENAPGLQIVSSSYSDFDRSKAIPATQDLLQAHQNVVAIFGHNDDMALGAAQVVQEQGLENVLVTGVDGLMEAVLRIQDGGYAVTASNDPVLLSHMAVDVAIKILNGETVDDFVDAGTVIIDEENIEKYADPALDFASMVE